MQAELSDVLQAARTALQQNPPGQPQPTHPSPPVASAGVGAWVCEGAGVGVGERVGWAGLQARCATAARMCICCCLLLDQQRPLFSVLFPLFQDAQRQLAPVLQQLTALQIAGQSEQGGTVLAQGQQGQRQEQEGQGQQGQGRQGRPSWQVFHPLGAFLEALEPHILMVGLAPVWFLRRSLTWAS